MDGAAVKGVLALQVVRGLRSYVRTHGGTAVAKLSEPARALLSTKVLPSSWYPMPPYQELLNLLHRAAYGGSELAAREMGRVAAREFGAGLHRAFIRSSPAQTMRRMGPLWAAQYNNFGVPYVEVGDDEATMVLEPLAGLDRVYALVVAGATEEMLRMSGGAEAHVDIAEAPWLGAARVVFHARWTGAPATEP